ncbi:MAG: cobalt transporter CbiM [Planctomycetes bacterium]|nr:cobalt transporter CbiM [Planctomycetota bacterium]
MHIAEGMLQAPIWAGGAVIASAGVAIGLRQIKPEQIPQVAVLTAGFFVASLVHVPVGGVGVHLMLGGLVGVILGWGAFPAVLVGLGLQLLLFNFGGLTTLGVNTFNMAAPGVVMFYLLRCFVVNGDMRRVYVFGCVAGAGSMLGSAVLLTLSIWLSGKELLAVAGTVVVGHVPLVVIEGLITGWILVFLRKVKPEIFSIFLKKS